MVHPMRWKPFDKYLYTALNATRRSKNKNQFESWLLYCKMLPLRFLRLPFMHRFVFRDVNLYLHVYYLERMTQSWLRRTISTDILQSKWLFGIRMLSNIEYDFNMDTQKYAYLLSDDGILLNNTVQSKMINCINASNRLYSSEINRSYQNAKLQQLLEQYQDHSHVNLSGQELTDEDMKIVVQEIIIKKRCKQLLLESNKITSLGLSILAEGLHNNNTLNYLDLSHNQVSDDGIYFLVQALSTGNNALKKLALAKNAITDVGVKHLIEMIKTNKTLTQLDLCSNEISNEGIRLLTNAMETYNSTIELLWLTSNKLLTDTSVDYIIQMVEHNRSLKRLWIFKCSLSETGKEKLKELELVKINFRVYVNNWKD